MSYVLSIHTKQHTQTRQPFGHFTLAVHFAFAYALVAGGNRA